MASQSLAQVEPLLTRESRALWRAMAACGGDFLPRAGKRPIQVAGVQALDGVGVLVTVRGGPVTRDWVLVQEDGEWRLDLLQTSARRPWQGSAGGVLGQP